LSNSHKKYSILSVIGISIILCLIPYALWAQQPQVTATVAQPQLTIGDQTVWTIQTICSKSNTLTWTPLPDTIPGITIISKSAIDTLRNTDTLVLQQKIVFTGFDEGTFTLPAIHFYTDDAKQTITTEPITITVATITVDTTQSFKDIKPIIDIENVPTDDAHASKPWWKQWYIWLSVCVVLAAIMGYWLFKKKKKSIANTKTLLPHEWALQHLDRLKKKDYEAVANSKAFFTELSDIIRIYLEQRFHIPAMELPTAELMALLKKQAEQADKDALRKVRAPLKEMLQFADMVKFAKAQPSISSYETYFRSAIEIVQQTQQQEEDVKAS
jgi:hypothetical protein